MDKMTANAYMRMVAMIDPRISPEVAKYVECHARGSQPCQYHMALVRMSSASKTGGIEEFFAAYQSALDGAIHSEGYLSLRPRAKTVRARLELADTLYAMFASDLCNLYGIRYLPSPNFSRM